MIHAALQFKGLNLSFGPLGDAGLIVSVRASPSRLMFQTARRYGRILTKPQVALQPGVKRVS